MIQPMRAAVATALHPVERVLLAPVEVWRRHATTCVGLQEARAQRGAGARASSRSQAERALLVDMLEQENERLRGLLELRERLRVRSLAAEVLYEASDLYSRKVVIDRGATHGVKPSARRSSTRSACSGKSRASTR